MSGGIFFSLVYMAVFYQALLCITHAYYRSVIYFNT